jgi:hypothetical protein
MKRALFTLIAWIAVVPSARALTVLDGYLKNNPQGWELFLSGNGFELLASGSAGFYCHTGLVMVGNPIVPCNPAYLIGGTTSSFVLNGVAQPYLGFDSILGVIGDPMFISGATHALLTEPVSYTGSFFGCEGGTAFCVSGRPNYGFSINGMVGLYSVELLLSQSGQEYIMLEETFTFHRVPEPSTLSLMAVGLVGTLVYRRRFHPPSEPTP